MRLITAALLAATLLAACSGIPRRDSEMTLDRYMSYAGEPISDIHTYTHYDSWTPIDDRHLVVYTNVNEAYLLTVAPPCFNLPYATRIGITSRFPHTVSSGFDSVRVDGQSCRIFRIQPIDYRQMRADLREQKELKDRG